MIVFDLACANAHVFEAWFASSAAYEDQVQRRLVACPLCGDTGIAKAVMAPALAAKGNKGSGAGDRAALLALQRQMEAQSDYVGDDFARRARAMHDGDTPVRSIHGEATLADAAALHADGIAVLPLPFRPLATSDA